MVLPFVWGLMVLWLRQSLPQGRVNTKNLHLHVCVLPLPGVMGSPRKDDYTGPQPTAGLLPPPLPRSEMQSVLVQLQQYGLIQTSRLCMYVTKMELCFCFLHLYLSLSIKRKQFCCWIFTFSYGISILPYDFVSQSCGFMGQQRQHHLGACGKCRISGPTADVLNQNLPLTRSQVIPVHIQVWEALLHIFISLLPSAGVSSPSTYFEARIFCRLSGI